MQTTQRNLLLGVAAIAVGAVLAVALGDRGSEAPTVAKRKQGMAQRQDRLASLTRASEVPDDKKLAQSYVDDRWGHMGEQPDLLPHVGGAGETVLQPTRVWVGLNGDGERVYMRAIARLHNQRYERLDKNQKPKVGPVIRISDYQPGPVFQKLKGIQHIDDPADMPAGMEHQHPLYEAPTGDEGGGDGEGSGSAPVGEAAAGE